MATLIAAHGDVSVQRIVHGAGFTRLNVDESIFRGDTVRTGADSAASILFVDGSEVKMGASTTLVISSTPASRNAFLVLMGIIWAHMRPGRGIASPTANVVVRGTEIGLSVAADGATTLTVFDGDATISNSLGTADLSVDQQSVVRPGQAPTAPVAVDPTGLLSWTFDIGRLPLDFETPYLSSLSGSRTNLTDLEAQLTTAVANAPTDGDSWFKLGEVRRRLGDAQGALAAYSQCLKINPISEGARDGVALTLLSLGRIEDARAEVVGSTDAEGLGVLGLVDIYEAKLTAARQDLTAALAIDPSLASANALLGLVYVSEGDLRDAESHARSAVKASPASALALSSLSITLFFDERYDDARVYAGKALKADPSSPFALIASARMALIQQRPDQAAAYYERARAAAPYLWIVRHELGATYLLLDEPRSAASEFQAAIRLNPDSGESHSGLGLAYQQMGRLADAMAEESKAIALQPADYAVIDNMAATYIAVGLLDRAEGSLRLAVSDSPGRGILYARLADLYLARQNLPLAQANAIQAVKLLPNSAFAHYELGRVYLEQQRSLQAEQEFRIALIQDPQFSAAQYALGLVEQKNEAGPIVLTSAFDPPIIGGPADELQISSIGTPGANDRIQAAVEDPTAVRLAERSFGDTEIDAIPSTNGSSDLAASYLALTPDMRGVRGVSYEDQYQSSVQVNSDERIDTVNVTLGQKEADSPTSAFVTADYQATSEGLNNYIRTGSPPATGRFDSDLQSVTAGVSSRTPTSELRAVLGADTSRFSNFTPDAAGYDRFAISSLDGEVRWDYATGSDSTLTVGAAYGGRRRSVFADFYLPVPPPPITLESSFALNVKAGDEYVRETVGTGHTLSATAEVDVQQLAILTSLIQIEGPPPIPNMFSDVNTAVVVPDLIGSVRTDARSEVRVRVHRLFSTITDFELLDPNDVFLLSYAQIPSVSLFPPLGDGTSTEIEYDRTLNNGSFLTADAYHQDLRNGSIEASLVGAVPEVSLNGLQAALEGSLGPRWSYFTEVQIAGARDKTLDVPVADVPYCTVTGSLQYATPSGYYGQVQYYSETSRLIAEGVPGSSPAFDVENLRIGRRLGLRVDLFAEVDNAFNKAWDVSGVIQPGREERAGVTLRF